MNFFTGTNKSLKCGVCGEKKERRVMSPFISFTPTTLDWVAEIRIPVYEKGEYKTGGLDVCADCFQKISDDIGKFIRKKPKKKKVSEQMTLNLEGEK